MRFFYARGCFIAICFAICSPLLAADFLPSSGTVPTQSLKVGSQSLSTSSVSGEKTSSTATSPASGQLSSSLDASHGGMSARVNSTTDELSVLQQSVATIRQDQQQALLHISALSQRDHMLAQQLLRMNRELNLLNAQMPSSTLKTNLSNQTHKMKQQLTSLSTNPASFSNSTKAIQWPTIVALLAMMLSITSLFFMLKHKNDRQQLPVLLKKDSALQDEEYDFMNSEEGVTAKLDLARAYAAMQDYTQMQTVLNEVIATGDNQQVAQARNLLKEYDLC
jgi:FimV-like protein